MNVTITSHKHIATNAYFYEASSHITQAGIQRKRNMDTPVNYVKLSELLMSKGAYDDQIVVRKQIDVSSITLNTENKLAEVSTVKILASEVDLNDISLGPAINDQWKQGIRLRTRITEALHSEAEILELVGYLKMGDMSDMDVSCLEGIVACCKDLDESINNGDISIDRHVRVTLDTLCKRHLPPEKLERTSPDTPSSKQRRIKEEDEDVSEHDLFLRSLKKLKKTAEFYLDYQKKDKLSSEIDTLFKACLSQKGVLNISGLLECDIDHSPISEASITKLKQLYQIFVAEDTKIKTMSHRQMLKLIVTTMFSYQVSSRFLRFFLDPSAAFDQLFEGTNKTIVLIPDDSNVMVKLGSVKRYIDHQISEKRKSVESGNTTALKYLRDWEDALVRYHRLTYCLEQLFAHLEPNKRASFLKMVEKELTAFDSEGACSTRYGTEITILIANCLIRYNETVSNASLSSMSQDISFMLEVYHRLSIILSTLMNDIGLVGHLADRADVHHIIEVISQLLAERGVKDIKKDVYISSEKDRIHRSIRTITERMFDPEVILAFIDDMSKSKKHASLSFSERVRLLIKHGILELRSQKNHRLTVEYIKQQVTQVLLLPNILEEQLGETLKDASAPPFDLKSLSPQELINVFSLIQNSYPSNYVSLIKSYGTPEVLSSQDNNGLTLLHHAVKLPKGDFFEVVKFIDSEEVTSDVKTSIWRLVHSWKSPNIISTCIQHHGSREILNYLLRNMKIETIMQPDEEGNNPYHMVVNYGSEVDLLELVNVDGGSSINEKNLKGYDALATAVECKRFNEFSYLIKYVDIAEKYGKNSYTLLHIAAANNHLESYNILRQISRNALGEIDVSQSVKSLFFNQDVIFQLILNGDNDFLSKLHFISFHHLQQLISHFSNVSNRILGNYNIEQLLMICFRTLTVTHLKDHPNLRLTIQKYILYLDFHFYEYDRLLPLYKNALELKILDQNGIDCMIAYLKKITRLPIRELTVSKLSIMVYLATTYKISLSYARLIDQLKSIDYIPKSLMMAILDHFKQRLMDVHEVDALERMALFFVSNSQTQDKFLSMDLSKYEWDTTKLVQALDARQELIESNTIFLKKLWKVEESMVEKLIQNPSMNHNNYCRLIYKALKYRLVNEKSVKIIEDYIYYCANQTTHTMQLMTPWFQSTVQELVNQAFANPSYSAIHPTLVDTLRFLVETNMVNLFFENKAVFRDRLQESEYDCVPDYQMHFFDILLSSKVQMNRFRHLPPDRRREICEIFCRLDVLSTLLRHHVPSVICRGDMDCIMMLSESIYQLKGAEDENIWYLFSQFMLFLPDTFNEVRYDQLPILFHIVGVFPVWMSYTWTIRYPLLNEIKENPSLNILDRVVRSNYYSDKFKLDWITTHYVRLSSSSDTAIQRKTLAMLVCVLYEHIRDIDTIKDDLVALFVEHCPSNGGIIENTWFFETLSYMTDDYISNYLPYIKENLPIYYEKISGQQYKIDTLADVIRRLFDTGLVDVHEWVPLFQDFPLIFSPKYIRKYLLTDKKDDLVKKHFFGDKGAYQQMIWAIEESTYSITEKQSLFMNILAEMPMKIRDDLSGNSIYYSILTLFKGPISDDVALQVVDFFLSLRGSYLLFKTLIERVKISDQHFKKIFLAFYKKNTLQHWSGYIDVLLLKKIDPIVMEKLKKVSRTRYYAPIDGTQCAQNVCESVLVENIVRAILSGHPSSVNDQDKVESLIHSIDLGAPALDLFIHRLSEHLKTTNDTLIIVYLRLLMKKRQQSGKDQINIKF